MKVIHNEKRLSGNKKSDIKYHTDSKPVDRDGKPLPLAVAMVAKCVAHYRKLMKPIKTIYLCPAYYNQFDYWVRKKCLEYEADVKWEMLTFDGVEIHKQGQFHVIKSQFGTVDFDFDFYPSKPIAQA
jgi:hypothetical protein